MVSFERLGEDWEMKVSRTAKRQPKTMRMEKNEEETWIREALVRETNSFGKKGHASGMGWREQGRHVKGRVEAQESSTVTEVVSPPSILWCARNSSACLRSREQVPSQRFWPATRAETKHECRGH